MIRCHSSGSSSQAEIHRALHVGEEDRDLLALAFERAARGEDLLGEMLRGVGAGIAVTVSASRGLRERLPAFAAKSFTRLVAGPARGTDESEGNAATGTELPTLPILATAG